jgi:hypothetical protein
MRISTINCPPSQIAKPETAFRAVKDGCGMALYFDWRSDRYGQRLCAIVHGEEMLVAQSLENVQRETHFACQAFQELSRQPIGQSELIFLVGLADGDYWSSSVEILPSLHGFEWDVSCKPAMTKTLITAFKLAVDSGRLDENVAIFKLDEQWQCIFECKTVENHSTQLVFEDSVLSTKTIPAENSQRSSVRWKLRVELRGTCDH